MTEDVSRPFASALAVILAVGATIWLGAPPLLFGSLAQKECVELVTPKAVASAGWSISLPAPHWDCRENGVVIATFPWLVTSDWAAHATLK